MRPPLALVLLCGCAGDPPRDGGTGPDDGGQTGQSGTAPPTCEELHPEVELYPFDAPTPLGFSAAEAMAAMAPIAATITWSDGVGGPIGGTVGLYDDPAPPVTYRLLDREVGECAPALTLRAAMTLASEDGRVDATFVSNAVVLWDLGAARLGETGRSADGWVDLAFLELEPPASESGGTDLAWIVEVDGAASTGVFRWFDRSAPEGGDWLDIGAW